MSCGRNGEWRAEMEKCSRPSQTTVIFAAVDALVENIYVEDHCQ